jgi:uncharacterized integral membrane protein
MPEATRDTANTPRLIGIIVLVVAVGAFIVQNTQSVDLSWLVFSFSAPLWIMLLIVGVVGVAIGWLLRRSRSRSHRS